MLKTESLQQANLLRYTTYASVLIAALLIIIKLYAWWQTESIGLLASLIDSTMDIAASLLNMIAVGHALRPADSEHRFGHGKAESLAGLGQSVFIAGSALFLISQALDRFINPEPLSNLQTGMGVILISLVLTIGLTVFQRYTIQKTGSSAIKADELHYKGDIFSNIGILIALFLADFGFFIADPVIGLLIGVYILYCAWEIGWGAIQTLMDHELSEEVQLQIESIARNHKQVIGIHDLRTRQSGLVNFVQMHVDLDKNMRLEEAHGIAEEVEASIKAILPNTDVIIHQDPVDIDKKASAEDSQAL